ncbi:MAG: phosphoribosylformylglycinamidine cyclo-ligase [Chloroflexi bacterium]|jgi:phosphoribosylformylglycinamidine cyclo-ligase|nr:MAG: phosphoribosylformylglycinamidine cyclo-ligase [Chloroflexota bacterium]
MTTPTPSQDFAPDHRGQDAYQSSGVDTRQAEQALDPMLSLLRSTWTTRPPVLDFGHFANVIDVGPLCIAISTDGVGTKTIIAQIMNRYDTIGIDCVAMNVNDVLCLGAEPWSLVDYIAVQRVDPKVLEEIAKGLAVGARQANINISGGELAQLPELLRGEDSLTGIDLAGTCVGTVERNAIIDGAALEPGHVVIGLRSSGIHSNGMTLARKAFGLTAEVSLAEKRRILSEPNADIGRPLGQELLEPTVIYVQPVMAMLKAGVRISGMAHITGDGFLNLPRLSADVGYVLDTLPEPQPIFRVIQQKGSVDDNDMYEIFNMGIGFCVIVPEADAPSALKIAGDNGAEAAVIGHVVAGATRTVTLAQLGLRGRRGTGFRQE